MTDIIELRELAERLETTALYWLRQDTRDRIALRQLVGAYTCALWARMLEQRVMS